MSQIVGVILGGVLTLAGGFTAQVAAANDRRRERAHALVSAFLTDLQLTLVEIAKNNPATQSGGSIIVVLAAVGVASRSGTELALLSPTSLRDEIRGVLEDLTKLAFIDGTDRDKFDPARDAYLARVKALSSDLYERFGQRDPVWWRFWSK